MRKTVDAQEIQNFKKDSGHWWDENGPFYPLHRLNPLRAAYIREQLIAHFGLDTSTLKPLAGLRVIDVGCGGGLLCEPLARMGAEVTGIDADEQAIAVAREHARQSGLEINYECGSSEMLAAEERRFDVVLALEIAEHVADLDMFAASCAAFCKPGGMAVFSTLNRTPQSFLLGILAAEYILRWVPRGTHSWEKFIRPSELIRIIGRYGLKATNTRGITFNIKDREFRLSNRLSINYIVTSVKT